MFLTVRHVCVVYALAATLTGRFSLLDAVGLLLYAAQHINGLSPTSQIRAGRGAASWSTRGAGMRA